METPVSSENSPRITVMPQHRRARKLRTAENIEAARNRPRPLTLGFVLSSMQVSGMEIIWTLFPLLLGLVVACGLLFDARRFIHSNDPLLVIAATSFCGLWLAYLLTRNLSRVNFMRTQAFALAKVVRVAHSQQQVKMKVAHVDGERTIHDATYTLTFQSEDGRTIEATFNPGGLCSHLIDQEQEVIFYDPENPTRCLPMDIFDGEVGISRGGWLVSRSFFYGWVRPLLYIAAACAHFVLAALAILAAVG